MTMVLMSVCTGSVMAQQKPATMTPVSESHLDQLTMLSKELRRIVKQTAREHQSSRPVTISDVLDKTGKKSPGKILEWVRSSISHEPYFGALRSPEVVLETGSANAVDAARLLHALLKEAGLKPRYAWGTLPAKDTSVLLLKFGELVQLEVDGKAQDVDAPLPSNLRANVEDHVWVELPMKGGEVQALDPFASLDALNTPAKRVGGGDDVPARLRSTFQSELLVTFKDGRQQSFLPVKGSLDDVAHKTWTISFERDDTLKHTTRPVLTRGSDVQVGDYFPRADVVMISLKYEIKTGAYQQLWEQSLYEVGRSKDIFGAEQLHVGVTVLPGWVSPQLVAARGAQGFNRAFSKLEVLVDEQKRAFKKNAAYTVLSADEYNEQTRALLDDTSRALPFLFISQVDSLIQELGTLMGVTPVLVRPRVVTTAIVRDRGEVVLDVSLSGGRLDAMPDKGAPESVKQGFISLYSHVESRLRSMILDALATEDVVTAGEIFKAAKSQGVFVVTLSVADTSQAKQLKLSKSLTRRLAASVKRAGQVVLAPVKDVKIGKQEYFAWWEVDPVSGSFSGVEAQGLLNKNLDKIDEVSALQQGVGFVALGKLLGKQIGTWIDSLGSSYFGQSTVCASVEESRTLSARLCQGKSGGLLPKLEQCLFPEQATLQEDDGGGVGSPLGDPLGGGFQAMTCLEMVRPAQCGTVIAEAFLSGRVKVLRGNAIGEFVASSGGLQCSP